MARLQIPTQAQVAPGQIPGVDIQAPQSQAGAVAAQQTGALGQAIGQAAQQAERIQIDVLQRANTLRVNEALNKVRAATLDLEYGPDGFRQRKGEQALPDAFDGKPMTVAYGERFEQTAGEIAQSLGNDAQRQAFQQSVAQLGMSFRGQAQAHEAGEFLRHEQSVIDGGIALSLNEAHTAWDTPDRARAALANVRALTIEKFDRFGGLAANEQTAMANVAVSDGVVGLVRAAADADNLALAQAYAEEYKDTLTGKARTDIAGIITPALEAKQAQSIIDRYTRPSASGPEGSPLAQTPENRRVAFNILIGSEGGLDRNGRPRSSPVGARGVAQVMEGTGPEAARLAGLPWDREKWFSDNAYNRALGEAYFNHQVDKFGGDIRKAWAAYNAGPRWVEAAQARAAAATPGTPQADWFWQLNNDGRSAKNRRETENYVNKNTAEYRAQRGGGAPITEIPLSQVLANAEAELGPNASPRVRALVRAGVTANYNLIKSEVEEQRDQVLVAVQQALIDNGGRMDMLSPSQRSSIPADKYDEMLTFARAVASGAEIKETPPAIYYQLQDDRELMGLSEAEFLSLRTRVAPSDWEAAARRRQALRAPNPEQARNAQIIPRDRLNAITDTYFIDLGIPRTGGGSSGRDVERRRRVGAIMQVVDAAVLDAQAAKGSQLNDDELRRLVQPLFSRQSVIDRGLLGGRREQALFATTESQIKATPEWSRIQDHYRRAGVANPTDTQVETAYYRLKMGLPIR